jgi:hypothetical protein
MTSMLLGFTPDHPTLRIVVDQPRGELSLAGITYVEEHFAAPFLGFYDWLRAESGQLVGFRMTLGKERDVLAALLPHHEYIVRHTDYRFSVMFRQTIEPIDEEASTEQDFGESRMFVASSGEIVLVIDTAALSDEEIASMTSMSQPGLQ